MKAATTLAEIRETCSPKPLDQEGLDHFFVETSDARDDLGNLRLKLKELFTETDAVRRVLVYGHRGSGKSTELNRFRQELGVKDWLVVRFSIRDYLPDFGIHAEDILLAIAVAIYDAGVEEKLNVSEEKLSNVKAFFASVTQSEEKTKEKSAEFSGGVGNTQMSALASLFGLLASIKGDLKFGSRSEKSTVLNVRSKPSDLIVALDELIGATEEKLKKQKRKLLVIVEDMDKMNLADAQRVFVENAALLASPSGNLIYTIPLFTFHSSDAEAIRAVFDDTIPFPMMEVVCLNKELGRGFHVIKEIVRKRVSESILKDDALELLIRGTGGVLRNLFEALILVSSFRNIKDRAINTDDIRSALSRLAREMGTQIGWPRDEKGGRQAPDNLFARLAEIAVKQSEGKAVFATSDSLIEVLLRSGALIEYNGGGWLGVHPLAWKFLRDLRLLEIKDPYGIEP